jgi:Hemopexin
MYDYFFSGNQYIRVTRGDTGPGVVDAGYPRTISPNWGWGSFGANGIDAALYSGSKCYFFAGGEYIRVTRAVTGPRTIDPGYPRPIAPNWGWGAFGANGIDAALYSNSKCYFFSGKEYIRVTRGETGPGTVDAGYPRPISVWGWGSFGANGIDAALYSGSRCYFFSGDQYIFRDGVCQWHSDGRVRSRKDAVQKSSSRILVLDPRRSADTEASLPARIEDRGDESTS